MVYTLVSKNETPEVTPEKEQNILQKGVSKGLEFGEDIAHKTATAATAVGSLAIGLPGNVFKLLNLAASPIAEAVSGKKQPSYEESFVGKAFPTSKQWQEKIHEVIPFTKPRNKGEEFANDVIGTTATFMIPGAQANVGKFARISKPVRAFIKGLGSNLIGEEVKDLTGSETAGEVGKIGSLAMMALLDRQSSGQYLSQIFNRARNALTNAGNPTVNAERLTNNLNNLRTDLTSGTLAESEAAVVQDIDRTLAHVQGGRIHVENLWGSLRSINERKIGAQNSIAGRTGRLRARNLYNRLTGDLNTELGAYGRQNPNFGIPFEQAQTGFRVSQQSNFVSQALDHLTGIHLHDSGLLNAFGGGTAGAAAVGTAKIAASPKVLGGIGAYQTLKTMYRIAYSPALRTHYFRALGNASREMIPQFISNVKKMDKIMEKEDKVKKPYRIIKKDQNPYRVKKRNK